jgi:hypothetical protein
LFEMELVLELLKVVAELFLYSVRQLACLLAEVLLSDEFCLAVEV